MKEKLEKDTPLENKKELDEEENKDNTLETKTEVQYNYNAQRRIKNEKNTNIQNTIGVIYNNANINNRFLNIFIILIF